MAGNFLSQLLSTENSVESEEDARCSVCLQAYYTLTDNGAIECEIRLPCGHSMGSMCAFTWLNSNNTCPFCRQEFFPAQPRPYLEHGIMENDAPILPMAADAPRILREDGDDLGLVEAVRLYCSAPCWNEAIFSELFRMAEPMAETLRQHAQSFHYCRDEIAGAAIYIASHLLGHPRSSLEISRIALVHEDRIRSFYRRIYDDREILIDPSMLEVLGRGRLEDVLTSLLPSDSDEEVIHHEDEAFGFPINPRLLRSLCVRFCHQLGHRDSIVYLAQQIAERIMEESHHGVCLHTTITAVSIFMALHLVGIDASFEQVSVIGVAASTIQDSYRQLYPRRNRLITLGSLEYIGRYNKSGVLAALTSLSWPLLTPDEERRLEFVRHYDESHSPIQ